MAGGSPLPALPTIRGLGDEAAVLSLHGLPP